MTITVGIHEGKTQFPRLVSTVEETLEEVLITRHGKPVARIVPIDDREKRLAERNERLRLVSEQLRANVVGPPITRDEIVQIIREGRDGR